ncbi:DNA repair protein RecO [candidate division KSB1 bacterium]
MAILDSEAVILSSIPQGETSKIVRLLTRNHGRVSVIAKGSRKWKNRFGGVLEQLNHVSVVYYYKESRDLQILTQCDTINPYQGIKSDLDKLALALSIAEITQNLFLEESECIRMFSLLTGSLGELDAAVENYFTVYWLFLVKFLRINGFGIDMVHCRKCGIEIDKFPVYFSKSKGGVICGNCVRFEAAKNISGEAFEIFRSLQKREEGTSADVTFSENTIKELNNLFDGYFRFHIEGYMTPNAMKLLG